MSRYVDWAFAAASARRLAPSGPKVEMAEAHEIIEEIRALAAAAHEPVAATAQMVTPPDAPPPLVVDRGLWIDTNARSMSAMLDPVVEQAAGGGMAPSSVARLVGGKLTALEAGGLLAFMSAKVLGQYDIAPGGTPTLMLVAPNMVQVAQELDLVPRDFRFWVCLHEETHRVQFTAVPWLREHVITTVQTLMSEMVPEPGDLPDRLQQAAREIPRLFGGESNGLMEIFATPEQRAQIADLTAVMSLLEGHADVVMDDVGPEHVPTVATIRQRFEARRKSLGSADKVLRRLLGLEAKMRQYRDGAAFVRGVQEAVGVEGFNAVWTSPHTLPRAEEITDPQAWVARVHG